MVEHVHALPDCPTCRGALRPRSLGCDPCGVTVSGRFELNEFAALGPEDLHLLRLFVRTGGSIRDLEAALGLSYPTIKSKLAALRARLGLDEIAATAPAAEPSTDILTALERGELTGSAALAALRAQRQKTKRK